MLHPAAAWLGLLEGDVGRREAVGVQSWLEEGRWWSRCKTSRQRLEKEATVEL